MLAVAFDRGEERIAETAPQCAALFLLGFWPMLCIMTMFQPNAASGVGGRWIGMVAETSLGRDVRLVAATRYVMPLLAEARKEGREARYIFDHLLQVLVVRKLLAEGFSAAAIKKVIEGRSNNELESLLQGSLRIDLVPEAGNADIAQRALRGGRFLVRQAPEIIALLEFALRKLRGSRPSGAGPRSSATGGRLGTRSRNPPCAEACT